MPVWLLGSWKGSQRDTQLLIASVWVVTLGLLGWMYWYGPGARSHSGHGSRPALVVFVNGNAPLSGSFEETLAAPPVQQLVHAHFTLRRLDALREQALFRSYMGSAGALGSAVIDEASPSGPDVMAVLPGYADVARFSEFLDTAAHQLPELRELRDSAKRTGADEVALGELYAQQGSLARARQCFESLKAPDPALAAALERLARLDVETGKTQSARNELERAQSTTPPARPERLLLTEALILSSERRVGAAVARLTQALPVVPAGAERARGWLLLGKLEHEIGQDERALTALEKARSEAQKRELRSAVDEQIFHIEHPEPGHVH